MTERGRKLHKVISNSDMMVNKFRQNDDKICFEAIFVPFIVADSEFARGVPTPDFGA